jgi:cystathionine beta-lyase/cystathionine gamma-synthase
MLIIADAKRIIEIAHKYKSVVIVDNTFATPMLWKPLDFGADLVIHSATKYLSGHGNLTAGAICGNDLTIMKEAIEYRKFVGHMLSPDDAYRFTTQIQSFNIRFRQQCNNAFAIANSLEQNEKISKVLYPGLSTHSTYNQAKNIFGDKGYGAMLTFDFEGKTAQIKRTRRDNFISAVADNIKLIPTLGDSHTILMPVESVWGYKYPEPGMIRMSVGFEDTNHILEVIKNGLQSC